MIRPSAAKRGFTLVEVLVALVVMALIAALTWRGVDGMLRARDGTQASIERTTRLDTVLAQWQQDLQSIAMTSVPALHFDGQTLRLTRLVGGDAGDAGVQVVAWALRDGVWTRWAGAPVKLAQALQEQWLASQQLQGNEPAQVKLMDGVAEWQVYFFRQGRKTNAQSTGDFAPGSSAVGSPTAATQTSAANDAASAPAPAQPLRETLPDAVELVIKLPAGTLTRDVAVVQKS